MGDLVDIAARRPQPPPVEPTVVKVLMPCGHVFRMVFEATGGELHVDARGCTACAASAPADEWQDV